ncbi:MAG: GlxA family transcriptional regulator [Rhodobacteraceae bacterium]|nr:GlxA family transcriptional regulator [Paracoccaceae bacterium]
MNFPDINPVERSQRVGFLLIDGFALLSFASAVEPLRAANLLGGGELYCIRTITVAGEEARSSSGAVIPGVSFHSVPAGLDLLLVVAGGDPLKFDAPRELISWLRMQDQNGTTIGGVSGGPVILASCGLMKGRRMTVHWEHSPALRELEPEVLLEQALYIIDRNRITCAGGTAPLDLMHSLITERHGPDFARLVSDWFMHTEVRHWRQPQRAGLVERHGTTNRAVLNAIRAMEDHVADPLSLSQLASLSEVGERQLSRQFAAEFGVSVMRFYRTLRLRVAAGMLTGSSLPLTDIALASGFADSSHFSRVFSSSYGVSPRAFRRGAAATGHQEPKMKSPG